MTSGITHLDAVEIVLRELGRPLSSKELVHQINRRELADIKTRTPVKSLNARLSVDIKVKGEKSRFKRVAPGVYTLREDPAIEFFAEPHKKTFSSSSTVWAFPSSLLNDLGHFHGIRRDYEKYFENILQRNHIVTVPRRLAEADASLKQVVSYVMVKHEDSLLRYTRGVISTLGNYFIGQYSIGFGGHVEGNDWNWNLFNQHDHGYHASVKRELWEEVRIAPDDISPHNFRMVGVLNDDSTDLGRRHFAFLHLLELPDPVYSKGEISINELRLVEIPRLSDDFAGYEYWSKLCIQTFFGDRLSIGCYVHAKPDFSFKDQAQIVLVTGYIGSGKTEACSLLVERYSYIRVPCSSILQELIGCPPMKEIGRRSLQNLGYEFVQKPDGHDRLAEAIVQYIKDHAGERFVLDGLRYPQTLNLVARKLGKPIGVVYIESTVDSLYQFYKNRNQEAMSFSDFLNIINHPVEREIERFYPMADVTIYNHGSKEKYLRALHNYLEQEFSA